MRIVLNKDNRDTANISKSCYKPSLTTNDEPKPATNKQMMYNSSHSDMDVMTSGNYGMSELKGDKKDQFLMHLVLDNEQGPSRSSLFIDTHAIDKYSFLIFPGACKETQRRIKTTLTLQLKNIQYPRLNVLNPHFPRTDCKVQHLLHDVNSRKYVFSSITIVILSISWFLMEHQQSFQAHRLLLFTAGGLRSRIQMRISLTQWLGGLGRTLGKEAR
ncbi:hypothetical protein E1301_Tti005813 [Triplophysa tibetana]|uniref:Uncharacterized protein n=1 Tax=Triplophysa tibetana TaxID=1572043 RepID=A0A5A9NFY3_9TELE|nr:hypothetical protein E1301_Tti005813 [Triplophysa tibetana]